MIQRLADQLSQAESSRTPCAALTNACPELSLEDAYAIQALNVAARIARGARPVGRKIGITSAAVQQWLNVDHPDFGALLDDMQVPDGGVADFSRLLQPRVEGEIAFVLKRDLDGASTSAQVLAAVDFVVPAIEIIDSRVRDWKIKLQDTVADNASCGLFALGSRPVSMRGLDLRLAGMALRRNGEVASTGAGAACMENPVNAVVWLARQMSALGRPLRAGEVILSGAMGPVAPVEPGDWIEVQVSGLGSVSARFSA